jgi:hypothetical protein
MKRNIDNDKGFLKEKLGGYQAEPPQEVWAAISGRLGGRHRGRRVIILLSAAASVALAVTLGITYFGRDIPRDMNQAALSGSGGSNPEERVVQTLSEGISSHGDREENPPAPKENRMAVFTTESGKKPNAGEKNDLLSPVVSEILKDAGDVAHEKFRADGDVLPEPDHGKDEENPEPENLALDAGDAAAEEILMDLDEGVQDPRWVLGAVLSPLYSFRDAQPEALAGTSGQESGTISYAAGVQVGYRATRRLAIESGVFFNKMGISIGAPGIQVFADADYFAPAGPESVGSRVMAVTNTVGNIVSSTGEIFVNNYLLNASKEYNDVTDVLSPGVNADQGIRQHLDYLEVPFNLRYTVLDRNFKIQLLGGMSTNLLVNNYVTMEADGITREIGYLANVRNVNYSGNAGIGFVYHILDQLSLNVEPRFRYYLNSVNDATLPSTHPYTFGIYTGINYFF